jgi:hypothetical protein
MLDTLEVLEELDEELEDEELVVEEEEEEPPFLLPAACLCALCLQPSYASLRIDSCWPEWFLRRMP